LSQAVHNAKKTRIVGKPVTSTFGDSASDAQIDYFRGFGGKYVLDWSGSGLVGAGTYDLIVVGIFSLSETFPLICFGCSAGEQSLNWPEPGFLG
jgi:hypothetical protein